MDIFSTYSIDDILKYGIAVLFLVAAILAVIYMVLGGFFLIISGGNEDRVKKAVNYIRYSVLGIAIMIVVVFVAPILFDLVGLPYGNYFRPGTIFTTIQELSGRIFSDGSSTTIYAPPGSSGLPSDFTEL